MRRKNIVILGSTGSVGTQTLDVIRKHADMFHVYGLACGSNSELLQKQACEFQCDKTAINDPECIFKMIKNPNIDIVVFAMSHTSFSLDVLRCALETTSLIALASKEAVIEYGLEIRRFVTSDAPCIIPIDSEMSAIFQILQSYPRSTIKKVFIPCTGGPFYGKVREKLRDVTVKEAIAHPRWKMGEKISIDSATFMNKVFEIFEAAYMFDLRADQIEIFYEPEANIHAVVEFKDGTYVAHRDVADMRRPIEFALLYPESTVHFQTALSFEKPQLRPLHYSFFEGPKLAYRALNKGGNMPRRLMLANNDAVGRFQKGEIRFPQIFDFIQSVI